MPLAKSDLFLSGRLRLDSLYFQFRGIQANKDYNDLIVNIHKHLKYTYKLVKEQ